MPFDRLNRLQKKGTLVLTSLLEELGEYPFGVMREDIRSPVGQGFAGGRPA